MIEQYWRPNTVLTADTNLSGSERQMSLQKKSTESFDNVGFEGWWNQFNKIIAHLLILFTCYFSKKTKDFH